MTNDDAARKPNDAPLIAVPNVSEGRDERLLEDMRQAIESAGALVLDVHSDRAHNRSVFTLAGADGILVHAVAQMARVASEIDLTAHEGVHPRLGGLDVCPFVVDNGPSRAATAAREAARSIAQATSLPVFLYGFATRGAARSLPDLRAGGLEGLQRRVAERDLVPDEGPREIDPARGVVCVGARRPLIAFNVWLTCDADTARRIAARIRTAGGGRKGIHALGWLVEDKMSQVSMNLVSPDETGIDEAFERVAEQARSEGAEVVATEIVGLPPARYLPDEKREAARLLLQPGRSLESVLRNRV